MILTYQQLMGELVRLVKNKSSGTLFVRSECNHAITFTFESGQLTALYFGPRKGRKAIPQIVGITGGSCRFDSSGPSRPLQDLPSTQELLVLLDSKQTTTDSPQRQVSEDDGAVWNNKLDALQTVLTDFLGPIAGLIYEEAVSELGKPCNSRECFQRLVDKLVLNIEPEETKRFRGQAADILH